MRLSKENSVIRLKSNSLVPKKFCAGYAIATCASLYCSHAKQIKEILMSLDNNQKSLYQMATT